MDGNQSTSFCKILGEILNGRVYVDGIHLTMIAYGKERFLNFRDLSL